MNVYLQELFDICHCISQHYVLGLHLEYNKFVYGRLPNDSFRKTTQIYLNLLGVQPGHMG
jgi:hypothetical protein